MNPPGGTTQDRRGVSLSPANRGRLVAVGILLVATLMYIFSFETTRYQAELAFVGLALAVFAFGLYGLMSIRRRREVSLSGEMTGVTRSRQHVEAAKERLKAER